MSEFSDRLMNSKDDTQWRAGRLIADLEGETRLQSGELYNFKTGIINAVLELDATWRHHQPNYEASADKFVEFLMRAIREKKNNDAKPT